MTEAPETRYSRDIALGDANAALHDLAADLDEDVMDLATTLYPKSQGYQLMPVLRDGRDVGFRVSAPAWRTEVSCVSGSNMRYVNGKEMRYFSYSVHAESVIPGVLKAEKFARELASWLAIAFAIVFCVLFFFACQALADFLDLGVLLVPAALFAIFFVAGGALGTAVGGMIGGMIGRAVSAKAYREPAVVAAFSSWDQLLDGLDDILDRAEAQAEERASVL